MSAPSQSNLENPTSLFYIAGKYKLKFCLCFSAFASVSLSFSCSVNYFMSRVFEQNLTAFSACIDKAFLIKVNDQTR